MPYFGNYFGVSAGGGSCDYPSEDDVRFGVVFGNATLTGNLTLPDEEDVLFGVQYGTGGTEFTGSFGTAVSGDLATRIHQAFRNLVAQATPDIDDARFYRRSVLTVSPERDGPLPVGVVAPTPGRPVTTRKLLSKREKVFGFTALACAAQGGKVAVGDEWRLNWAAAVGDALIDADWSAAGVPEVINVNPDTLAIIDTVAFQDAKLWVATISLLIVCRIDL